MNQGNKLGTGLWGAQVLNGEEICVIGKRARILFNELIYLLQKDDVLDTILRTGHMQTNDSVPSLESEEGSLGENN